MVGLEHLFAFASLYGVMILGAASECGQLSSPRIASDTLLLQINTSNISLKAQVRAKSDLDQTCDGSQVGRRRRNEDMCFCRRRSIPTGLKPGWSCQGNQIVAPLAEATPPPPAAPTQASCSASASPGNQALACASFGRGIGSQCDCSPILEGLSSQRLDASFPRAGHITWACAVPNLGLALCDEERSMLTIWSNGSSFMDVEVAPLTHPVGAVHLNGKVYVACFGSWGTPGTAGLAVIDPFTGNLDATYAYKDGSFVHNVYTFTWAGQQELFVAVLGNPWWPMPVAGDGLVHFDSNLGEFVPKTIVPLNARSAVQQSDTVFYVLTQEANMGATRLVRLERNGDSLSMVASTALPSRKGGDGGADVFLGTENDAVFCTDRTDGMGKLYYYTYADGVFHLARTRNTGSHPRYTTKLANGDVVACNKLDATLTIFDGLATAPTATDIKQRIVPTVNDVSFFIESSLIR